MLWINILLTLGAHQPEAADHRSDAVAQALTFSTCHAVPIANLSVALLLFLIIISHAVVIGSTKELHVPHPPIIFTIAMS